MVHKRNTGTIHMFMVVGTGDEIRTHTPSPALQPECSASANFATPAKKLNLIYFSIYSISRKGFLFEFQFK